jgi:hypothetical protein
LGVIIELNKFHVKLSTNLAPPYVMSHLMGMRIVFSFRNSGIYTIGATALVELPAAVGDVGG